MSDPKAALTPQQATDGAPGWRLVLGRLQLTARFPDFASALGFVAAVGAIAEEQDHHPEINLRWGRVHLAVASHDVGAITSRDLRFAEAVSAILDDHGGRPQHLRLTEVEIGIDTLDSARIKPFWLAVLGYRETTDDNLTDPDRIGPTVWFQHLAEPNEVRNRIHLDVNVAHDAAQARIDAALAAGGRLVSDEFAPSWWILADADGNEACVCTWLDRD